MLPGLEGGRGSAEPHPPAASGGCPGARVHGRGRYGQRKRRGGRVVSGRYDERGGRGGGVIGSCRKALCERVGGWGNSNEGGGAWCWRGTTREGGGPKRLCSLSIAGGVVRLGGRGGGGLNSRDVCMAGIISMSGGFARNSNKGSGAWSRRGATKVGEGSNELPMLYGLGQCASGWRWAWRVVSGRFGTKGGGGQGVIDVLS